MGLFHCYACEIGVHYTDKCPETFLKKEEMTDRFNEGLEKGIELGMLKERSKAKELLLEYTYPDGSGTGGTFTDGDQFSQESIQDIIDNVIAYVQSDERNRAMRIVSKQLGETVDAGILNFLINDVNVL